MVAAAGMSLPASGPACTAAGAQYRLAGASKVAATLGKLPAEHTSLSDLYVRVEVATGDVLWFTMDRGNGHRDTFLHSSDQRLDKPLPPGRPLDYVVRSVSITFFDAKGTEVYDIVSSGDAAPPYFFLSDTDWPRNPGEAPERRPFPAELSSAMFVLDGCFGAVAEAGPKPTGSRK
jgi:hypothetical protein